MQNLLIGVLLAFPTNVQAAEIPTIPQLIEKYAQEYSVDPKIITNIINCETAGTFDPNIQSYVYKNGIREESYGLAQIHLPDHPAISKKTATNPDFAINYLAKNIKDGHISKWSCARILGYIK